LSDNTQKQIHSPVKRGMVMDIANPSDEHQMLREMVRDFVNEHVEPTSFGIRS